MTNWVGYAVSVNCGETLGCYQGTIVETDGATITITKAFRNGFPYPKSQVTLNASDIKELRIVSVRTEEAGARSAAVPHAPAAPAPAAPPAPARRARATVCETLQANRSTSTGEPSPGSAGGAGNNARAGAGRSPKPGGAGAARSKPLDIQASRKNNNGHAGSYGSGSTPKSRGNAFGGRGESTGIPGLDGGGGGGGGGGGERARRRNEACFGGAAESALDDDFDFEGNLALFDKRAVWASMRSSKPDVVRAADDSKYRHDENVLGGGGGEGAGAAALRVPDALRGARDYVTDGGCVVPSVRGGVRRALWAALRREGLAEFALAMVARAACDVALRLVGGGRRLEARNAHQAPCVVALCGAHRGGAAGLAAARLLASRGARLHALVAGAAAACAEVEREARALRADGVAVRGAGEEGALPAAPDLVLVALYDPLEETPLEQYAALVRWWGARRGAAVCLEPGARGAWRGGGGGARACVLGGAPVPLSAALGRLYLADVAAPQHVYRSLGLPSYRAPFGAAAALPLHPHTD